MENETYEVVGTDGTEVKSILTFWALAGSPKFPGWFDWVDRPLMTVLFDVWQDVGVA
jgi:hypothetical protein